MLKSCFGLGSLRSGVNVIAVVNMVVFLVLSCLHGYELLWMISLFLRIGADEYFDWYYLQEGYTYSDDFYDNLITWQNSERISELIQFILAVLLFISNVCLKQSTFKQAPHNIYAWLVITFATFLFLASHLVGHILLLRKYRLRQVIFVLDPNVGDFLFNILRITMFGLEILVVYSFYVEEEKARLNDIIQLQWKHVSNDKVLSQSTDYPTSPTFQEIISQQTQG